MTNPSELDSTVERLGRSSKRAALASFLGLALVMGALLYAMWQLRSIEAQRTELERQRAQLQLDVNAARGQLSKSREALSSARAAINAFHSGDLREALSLYDEALSSDPENAYLQNLRAYTLYRLGRTEEAIAGEQRSIQIEPNYAWGYFDLARFLCAATPSQMAAAKGAVQRAISLRPDLEGIMRSDGEFQRVCRHQLPE